MAKRKTDPYLTRRSLISAIKDPEANRRWDEFYNTYHRWIRAIALQSGLRRDEADDLTIEVLVSVARGIAGFKYDRSRAKFTTWLGTIVRRRIASRFRQRRPEEENKVHRPLGDERGTNTVDRQEDPSASLLAQHEEREWQENVKRLTMARTRDKVNAKHYQIFDGRVIQGKPTADVMRTLGVNRNQVDLAVSRVGKVFRKEREIVEKELENPDIPDLSDLDVE